VSVIGLAPHETVALIAATLLRGGVRMPHDVGEEKCKMAISTATRLLELANEAAYGAATNDEPLPVV
jgi:hypothetical protein